MHTKHKRKKNALEANVYVSDRNHKPNPCRPTDHADTTDLNTY